MILLVTGDRDWVLEDRLFLVLDIFHKQVGVTKLIQGGARGADRLSKAWADDVGVPCATYKADWDRFKRGAGPIRNQQMLDEEKIEYCLGFHDRILESSGTKDMLRRVMRDGIGCVNVKHRGYLREDQLWGLIGKYTDETARQVVYPDGVVEPKW